jgi:chromosome segregation ATPase
MSKEITQDLDGKKSFEERVFARFDAIDGFLKSLEGRVQNIESRVQNIESRVQNIESRVETIERAVQSIESRVQVLESRAYDTKPIWERALTEIVETRREVTRRLDRIEAMVLETRAGLSEAEDRLEKLESRPS